MYEITEKFKKIKLIPVIKIEDVENAVPLAEALIKGGLPAAEITFRAAGADKAIAAISKAFPDMLVGAGTVLTTEQVDAAKAAGATFIVSPGFNPKVVAYCNEIGIPVFPGCTTPSEIEQAIELGLDTVKFFPAEQSGGIDKIKAMAAPYTKMTFIPTGGISPANIKKYLAFNKVVACGGSFMVKEDLINNKEWDKITELTKNAVDLVNGKEEPVVKTEKKVSAGKVVTFGEIMLRLAPLDYLRFFQNDMLEATFGGGEANVAVSLANFGREAAFVTKLPDNDIGQGAINSMRYFGVDTSMITRGGERVGIYYLEKGASQRASKVVYDRAYSSISMATKKDFDWDKIFDDATWFHFTGITPALGDNVAEICLEACKKANEKGITVSCDLNFRKKLWSSQKAGEVMGKLMPYVDVCIANEEDADKVFGIKAENTDVHGGKLNHEGYKYVADELVKRFGCKYVAITLRTSISANDNKWAAMLYDGENSYFSKSYDVHIVDRVGGGDSFGAGLIYGISEGYAPQDALEFAVAASCLKHSIQGDFNRVTVSEVKTLMGGDGSGRVSR